jgi:hypothetical protein
LESNGYIYSADGLTEVKALTYAELDTMIVEAKRANDDALTTAGDIGHKAHAWIEGAIKAAIKGFSQPELPTDEKVKSCCEAFVSWSTAHQVGWAATERIVYSKLYKYAGTLDGLAYVSSCGDPLCCKTEFRDRLSIIDHKTSNGLYLEYLLQTSAYWQALVEEDPTLSPQDRWINRFGKEDGVFESWHAEGEDLFKQDFAAFLAAHNLVKAVDVVEERLADEKGMKKAHKLAKEKAEREAAHRIACPKSGDYKGVRKNRCFNDGMQCQACAKIYADKH